METAGPTLNGIIAGLWTQLANLGGILSQILLGDVVQKAIAQLVGVRVRGLYLTPVTFSFAWFPYAFMALQSAFSDRRLMPLANGSYIVNCDNGFRQPNRSWVLDRLLRDHEERTKFTANKYVQIRIDVFKLVDEDSVGPDIDRLWILGWVVILAQLGIAIVPWVSTETGLPSW